MMAVSCAKTDSDVSRGMGRISFGLDQDNIVRDVTRSNVSDYTSLPSKNDFKIVIKNTSGETKYEGLLSGWNESTMLPVGNYSVAAEYGVEGEEGFDKPYFTGEKQFLIENEKTTAVQIPVTLANTIVKVVCTDAFKNYFTSYNVQITTGAGSVFTYANDETRGLFMDAYFFTVKCTYTAQSGNGSSFSKTYGTASLPLDPATCYTLTLDASTVGNAHITITFDDTVETVDLEEELNK